jgi:superfamily I DNA/RNA helicase
LHRTIIPGPPGTGKTYRLTKYLQSEIDNKTDTQKIIYISFSNAAAKEAQSRISSNLYFVGTMHSLGTKELKFNTKTGLLKGNKWNSFKNYSKICKNLSFESKVNDAGYVEYTNPHMKIIEYARSKKIDIYEAAMQLDMTNSVEIWLTEQLQEDLINYKKHTGMFEYSDMI